MFKNSIAIRIEDLHTGETYNRSQGNFHNYAAAVQYCVKLNDYYVDNCIPRIASVVD